MDQATCGCATRALVVNIHGPWFGDEPAGSAAARIFASIHAGQRAERARVGLRRIGRVVGYVAEIEWAYEAARIDNAQLTRLDFLAATDVVRRLVRSFSGVWLHGWSAELVEQYAAAIERTLRSFRPASFRPA